MRDGECEKACAPESVRRRMCNVRTCAHQGVCKELRAGVWETARMKLACECACVGHGRGAELREPDLLPLTPTLPVGCRSSSAPLSAVQGCHREMEGKEGGPGWPLNGGNLRISGRGFGGITRSPLFTCPPVFFVHPLDPLSGHLPNKYSRSTYVKPGSAFHAGDTRRTRQLRSPSSRS